MYGLTNTHDVMLDKGPKGVKMFMSDYAAGDYMFKKKLTKPGKYVFVCELHQGMGDDHQRQALIALRLLTQRQLRQHGHAQLGLRLRLGRRRLGLRRQRLRAAAGREGLPRARARERPALRATRTSRRRTWDARRYFFAPRLGMRGIFRLTLFKDVFDRLGRGRRRRRRWATRTRSTARRRASTSDPQWRGARRLGGRARAALRRGRADARRDRRRPTTRPRPAAAGVRGRSSASSDTYAQDAAWASTSASRARRVPTRSSAARARRAPAASRCGACMVGCRARREEHAGQELPVVRRAARRADRCRSATVVDVRPLGAADGSDGYVVTTSAPARGCAAARRDAHRARRRRRGRRAGHQQAARAAASSAARCRASPTALGELVRTNSESILAVTAPDDARDFTQRGRDHAPASTPTPTRTSRPSPTATAATRCRRCYTLLVGDGTRVTRPLQLARRASRATRVRFAARRSTRAAGRGAR